MNLHRLLVSLMIVLAILPLSVSVFSAASRLNTDYRKIADEIAMVRLRKIWLLSYERNIEEQFISFEYDERVFELSLTNGKLILSPGTQIFMDGLDYLEFREEDDLVVIFYVREGENYEKILGTSQRFHLDDFSAVDDERDFFGDGDSIPDEDVDEGT